MSLAAFSLIGLIALYLISLYFGYVRHITNDNFYAPFHFIGGILTGLFFFSLTHNVAFSLVGTLMTGLLWEVYEQIVWKVFVKKKKFRPGRQDTFNDLCLDVLGSLLAVLLVRLDI